MPHKSADVSGHKLARPALVDLQSSTLALTLALHIGAGTSAESGIPTFRGDGGLWRQYEATDLGAINSTSRLCSLQVVLMSSEQNLQPSNCLPAATPGAFNEDPSLVWEFYHWRREVRMS